jgi:type I restriction enzyme, S subunit
VSRWPTVALGEVMTQRKEFIQIDDLERYKRCRVQNHARGVVLRDEVAGAAIKTKRQQVCRAGEILVAELDAKVGGYGVVPLELDGAIVSSHYFLFQADESHLDSRFMSWFMKTPAFRDQVRAQGSTNYASVRATDVLEYSVPLPPVEEQRRVVEKLIRLATQSARLRNLQRHVEGALDALLRARLHRLFGDPYHGTVGGGGFTEFAPVGELSLDVADGPHATPQYVDGGVPFVTVLNITTGRVDFSGAKHITSAAHELYSKRAKAEPGDVLISKDGTLGVPCYVDTDREFSFFVSVALVKPRRDLLDGRFLTWALRAPYLQDRIAERSRGDMIRHLVLREIRQLLVPVVSLADQRRIVSELDAAERRHRTLTATSCDSQGIATAIARSALAASFAVVRDVLAG